MPENRFALVIASYQYSDPQLKPLIAPRQDAHALAQVLEDSAIGGFQVRLLLNETSQTVFEAIEEFFDDKTRDDLLLFYFSGHGIKSEDGKLYFAQANTLRKRLLSTSIPADQINELMKKSRSKRQIMILDCCYSGAFAKGLVAKADPSMGLKERFEDGTGRIILTASDAMQYAFEGPDLKIQGEAAPIRSVFTNLLVEGLQNRQADYNHDGLVSPDDLHHYISGHIREISTGQNPKIWKFEAEGDIFIARYPTSGALLPGWISEALLSNEVGARLGAISKLDSLLQNSEPGIAAAARARLQALSSLDDNPLVRGAASGALGLLQPASPATASAQTVREEQPKAQPAGSEPKPARSSPGPEGKSAPLKPSSQVSAQPQAVTGPKTTSPDQPHQPATRLPAPREQLKTYLRSRDQDELLVCPWCASQVKTLNFIPHYDRHHPGQALTSLPVPPSPSLQKAVGRSLPRPPALATNRDKVKAYVRSVSQESLIACPFCAVPVRASKFISHYDEKHPGGALHPEAAVPIILPGKKTQPVQKTRKPSTARISTTLPARKNIFSSGLTHCDKCGETFPNSFALTLHRIEKHKIV